jgi:hypothetical protein
MVTKLRYDSQVRRLNPATGVIFALAVCVLTFTPALTAQINGTPASVTSQGFGGHSSSAPGVPPSVTSLGPNGFTTHSAPNNRFTSTSVPPQVPRHRHNDSLRPWGGGVYAVPYPVYIDSGEAATQPTELEDDYRGGPTIFDRRGPGTPVAAGNRYVTRQDAVGTSQSEAPAQAAPLDDEPQTTLVFKDGQQLDVANYAIVGNTLYDLTPGHRRKIALAELDLNATAKENDGRGIDFQLPPSAKN